MARSDRSREKLVPACMAPWCELCKGSLGMHSASLQLMRRFLYVMEHAFISLVHSLTHFGIFSNLRFHHFLLLQFQKIRGLSGVSHQVLVGGSRCLARSPPAPRRPGPTPPRRSRRSRRHWRNRRTVAAPLAPRPAPPAPRHRATPTASSATSATSEALVTPEPRTAEMPMPNPKERGNCLRHLDFICFSFGFTYALKLQGPVSINSEGVDAPRMLG